MRPNHNYPGLLPGLILISVGGGLVAREFGLLPPHVRVLDFWPLVVVFVGVAVLLRRRGFVGSCLALGFVGMGGVLLAANLGLLASSVTRLWPLLIVLFGIAVLLRGGRGPDRHWPGPRPPFGRPSRDGSPA